VVAVPATVVAVAATVVAVAATVVAVAATVVAVPATVVALPATVVLELLAGAVVGTVLSVVVATVAGYRGGGGRAAVLAMKLLTIVTVHVTVLAPVGPEPLHWSMVVGSPVLCEGGAVAVQVMVPPAPPDELHCASLWPPGPPEPA
jgi:hypothetical protein